MRPKTANLNNPAQTTHAKVTKDSITAEVTNVEVAPSSNPTKLSYLKTKAQNTLYYKLTVCIKFNLIVLQYCIQYYARW